MKKIMSAAQWARQRYDRREQERDDDNQIQAPATTAQGTRLMSFGR